MRSKRRKKNTYPPVIKHGWLENGQFIGDFPNKTSVDKGFSVAMFDYQRVRKVVQLKSFKETDSKCLSSTWYKAAVSDGNQVLETFGYFFVKETT